MPPSVDNTAAHGQQQDMGYYNLNMANEHPPLRDHRDHFIDNHGDFALDVPAQEPAIPSAPVCTDHTFSVYTYLTRPSL